MKILVTGASGFIGSFLIPRLLKEGYEVVALVRNKKNIKNKRQSNLEWVEGDLLKPRELPVLKGINKAFYLVHGLKGEEESFEHLEARASVNFLHWVRPCAPGIIYLGGLGDEKKSLSPHLRSRHLTGSILGASGLSVMEFRASIILGEGSLSFEMIKAISERFPIRPEFPLLNQASQPLSLDDLLSYLLASIKLNSEGHRVFEIGGPEALTYGELLDLYSEMKGLKRVKLKLPPIDPRILMRLLDYVIPEHSLIGKKLAESLEYPTIVSDNSAATIFPEIKPMDLKEAMKRAIRDSKTHYAPLWNLDFLKLVLSDKIISSHLSPDILKNLERTMRVGNIFRR